MAQQIYTLKKPIEYGGKLITEISYDDDPDELTPAQLGGLNLENLTVVSEITKSIAAVTKQPVELVESLKMTDWNALAQATQAVLGNALTATA